MDPINILVIEDDEIVARTIERCLRGGEFRVRLAGSGVEGLRAARRETPGLIILDVIMPGMDGYAVCREMRADPVLEDVPILFLTAKTKDEDKITGFTAGADDYLGKPFNVDELILRIRAIMRRSRQVPGRKNQPAARSEPQRNERGSGDERMLLIGPYTLNTRTYELTGPKSGKIRLTPVQYDLLYHLMNHPGEIFSPARLLDEVWDYPSDAGSPDLVRVHIKNLRERIEEDPRNPRFIKTVAGYGYTISLQEDDPQDEYTAA
jgi:two-component system, OmpR family, response regulator RpaA